MPVHLMMSRPFSKSSLLLAVAKSIVPQSITFSSASDLIIHAYEPGISQYGEQAAIILVYAAITILSERASVFRREIMSNLVECR